MVESVTLAPGVDMTVLICTFNRAASLSETLHSINRCELPGAAALELIVVDNNSSDDTRAVCDSFAAESRIPFRYFLEASQGLSFARNRGVSEARGRTIIFTDDDVLVEPNWLVAFEMEFADPGTACVFGRIHPDWRGSRPEWFHEELGPAYALLDYGGERVEVRTRDFEFYGANFGLRKDVLLSLGGFDTRLGRTAGKLYIGEETRVFTALLRAGLSIVYQPAIVVLHVIEDGRKTKDYLLRYYRDTAESMVLMASEAARRRLLGVPLFQVREFTLFLLRLPLALTTALVRRDAARVFVLRLRLIRTIRMLRVYLHLRSGPHGKAMSTAP